MGQNNCKICIKHPASGETRRLWFTGWGKGITFTGPAVTCWNSNEMKCNEGRKTTISNKCEVNCPSEERTNIARVEIVASLSVSRIQFFITSLSWIRLYGAFIAVQKVAIPRPRIKSTYFQPLSFLSQRGLKSATFLNTQQLIVLCQPHLMCAHLLWNTIILLSCFSSSVGLSLGEVWS